MSKYYSKQWPLSKEEIDVISNDIMKDLEYNYRLPESLITILIKRVKAILAKKGIPVGADITTEFGRQLEEILNRFDYASQETVLKQIDKLVFETLFGIIKSRVLADWEIENKKLVNEFNASYTISDNILQSRIEKIKTILDSIDELFFRNLELNLRNSLFLCKNESTKLTIESVNDTLNLANYIEDSIRANLINYSKNTIKIVLDYFDKCKTTGENITSSLVNPKSHFKNGHFLHSSQYYFAKRYFQSSENCEKLAILLVNKIKSLRLDKVTLVGFRSYIGLLLEIVKDLISGLHYVIVEPTENDGFTWQSLPNFHKINTRFVIVLPITCTCSTYIRISKFLKEQIEEQRKIEEQQKIELVSKQNIKKKSWNISRSFINIFLIQDSRLRNISTFVTLDKDEVIEKNKMNDSELSELYSDFNWKEVKKDVIHFGDSRIKKYKGNKEHYSAYPLVNLYSDLQLPTKCSICFPETDLKDEKNIFLTHNNFETPNLIQDFPNFGLERDKTALLESQRMHLKNSKLLFKDIFPLDSSNKHSHHYGHICVNNGNYLNYIRGNIFFEQNRFKILNFFNSVLTEIILDSPVKAIRNIVFITAESKHNSTFINEIINYNPKRVKTDSKIEQLNSGINNPGSLGALTKWKLKGLKEGLVHNISILSTDPDFEFIDNFMSTYINLLKNEWTLIIYFEEVFSAGETFKLLSNFLKHYKNIEYKEKEFRHGVDYVFSLIDRTPYHTKEEIFKKLYSNENKATVSRFISYFKLNVPIVAAAHLGNPMKEKVKQLTQLVNESHLDVVKKTIGEELPRRIATMLPEESNEKREDFELEYFPFEDDNGNVSIDVFEMHREILENGKIELLKLYVAHEINSILADNKYDDESRGKLEKESDKGNLINYILEKIISQIREENFFLSHQNYSENHVIGEQEEEIIKDTAFKILSKYPFTYYTKIYESAFKYCLKEIDDLRTKILNIPQISFQDIRRLRFIIRRLVDLDSSHLISKEFLSLIKYLCEFELPEVRNKMTLIVEQLDEDFVKLQNLKETQNKDFTLVIKNNLIYKYNTISSFFYFIVYSYKECISKNHFRAIKLEEIVRRSDLIPRLMKDAIISEIDLIKAIRDPYYQIIGAIRAENLFILDNLKELHKKIKYESLSENERDNKIRMEQKKWLNPLSSENIEKYYFESRKNDPIIIDSKKFVDNSYYANDPGKQKNIKQAIANMLKAATKLSEKMPAFDETDFLNSIKNVLKSIVDILKPGIENELSYSLCIKYSKLSGKSTDENIYVISSDDETTGSHVEPEGLIYNLIRGLYSSMEMKQVKISKEEKSEIPTNDIINKLAGEQSLLVAIKSRNSWYSFADKYFVTNNDIDNIKIESKSFHELIENDFKNADTGRGLEILANSTMNLFFRLSEVDKEKLENGNCDLEGKAALIITYKGEVNKENYLNFMNDEKVRLLLLIKEELLEYLKKITESSTFYELIKSKDLLNYQRTLKHGLDHYLDDLKRIAYAYVKDSDDRDILDTLITAIRSQIKAYDLDFNRKDQSFEIQKIIKKLKNILNSDKIAKRTVTSYNIKYEPGISHCFFDTFVIEIILIELIINAKRHSPIIQSDIQIYIGKDYFKIQNKILKKDAVERFKQGLVLCKRICKELNYRLKIEKDTQIFQITLNKKRDEEDTYHRGQMANF